MRVDSLEAWPRLFCNESSRIPPSHIRIACVCRSACGLLHGSRMTSATRRRWNSFTSAAYLNDSLRLTPVPTNEEHDWPLGLARPLIHHVWADGFERGGSCRSTARSVRDFVRAPFGSSAGIGQCLVADRIARHPDASSAPSQVAGRDATLAAPWPDPATPRVSPAMLTHGDRQVCEAAVGQSLDRHNSLHRTLAAGSSINGR
jgi:hypothetical protein